MAFPPTASYPASANYKVNAFLWDGDSMNLGTTAGSAWAMHTLMSAQANFSGKGQFWNVAVGGTTVAQQVAAFAKTKPYRPPLGHGFLFHWGGTAGLTETTFADFQAYWALARADGWKIVAHTLQAVGTDDGALQALRAATNASIRSDSTAYDYLVEMDLLLPDSSDLDYFSDSVHLTALGYETVAAHINSVLGLPVL
ncbi:MAG: SGNH/GDSL hydrolase family protein [Verrucomicrobia bacterium]|nr:SGNH/GDSL hydrolase family protein [Verrucomicrobiota bacterium]